MLEPHDCNFHDVLKRCINDRCPLHRGMRTLAECLRWAAALCASYTLGANPPATAPAQRRRLSTGWATIPAPSWRPGWVLDEGKR